MPNLSNHLTFPMPLDAFYNYSSKKYELQKFIDFGVKLWDDKYDLFNRMVQAFASNDYQIQGLDINPSYYKRNVIEDILTGDGESFPDYSSTKGYNNVFKESRSTIYQTQAD